MRTVRKYERKRMEIKYIITERWEEGEVGKGRRKKEREEEEDGNRSGI